MRAGLTITSDDQKLIVICNFVGDHVGESSHDLLFRREVGALLEFKITNGARERKVAVDTAKVDEASGCSYACLYAYKWFSKR